MKWKGPVAKLSEVLVRRRQRKIHPAVGLPKDAPAYLEAEDGSFVRLLPEEEYLPFLETGANPRVWTFVFGALAVLFFVLYAVVSTLNPDEELVSPTGIVLLVFLLLFFLFFFLIPVSMLLCGRNLSTRLPQLLGQRPSRLFEPEEWSCIVDLGAQPSFKPGRITGDLAVVRLGDGCMELEMSRAQARIYSGHLQVCCRALRAYRGVFRARARLSRAFGELLWSVFTSFCVLREDCLVERDTFLGEPIPAREPWGLASRLRESRGELEIECEVTGFEEKPRLEVRALTISTESREWHHKLPDKSFLLINLGAGLVVLGMWGMGSFDWTFTLSRLMYLAGFAGVLLGLLVIAKGIKIYRNRVRGRWVFSAEGIAFEPKAGTREFLPWEKVERVSSKGITLCGKEQTVSIPRWAISFSDYSTLSRLLSRELEPYFDMSNQHVKIMRLAWVPLALFLVSLARPIFVDFGPLGRRLYAFWLIMLIVLEVIGVILMNQRSREANPQWREKKTEGIEEQNG